jgi:uncharacterized membrane protein
VRFDTSGAVTDLQDLGPNSYIFTVSSPLKAINGTGMAVGELTKIVPDGISDSRAVRWDASGAITELGDLGTVNAYTTTSTALAINAAGTAVGHAQKGPPGPVPSGLTNLRAVRWDASGTAATELGNLGTDSSGRTESDAVAINDAGTAVGTAIDFSAAHPGRRAVRWNASGTAATELGVPGDLPGNYGAALAINAAGTAVGNASKVMSGRIYKGEVPVRWAASGTAATELGNLGLDSDGLVGGTAVAINDAGTAVGVIVKDLSTPTSRPRAVRWDATGTAATELGILPTSFDLHTETAPLGINAAGITVGYDRGYDSTDSYFHNTPVVWGKDAVAIDLNTLLPADSGWLLQYASGITDTNWVSGSGLFDPDGPGGQDAFTRMYLLDISSVVPEPGTFGLVAFCGIALLRRQRRSHEYNRLRARVIGGGVVRPRKNALSEHQPCWTHAIRHVAVGAVLCLTGRAGAAPMIYDLGSLGAGGTESHDVNDAGQVVGTSYAVNPISHAFR